METLAAHPIDEAQKKVIKAFFEALQVPYDEEPDTSESPYNPEFVSRILSEEAAGKFTTIKTDDLWK